MARSGFLWRPAFSYMHLESKYESLSKLSRKKKTSSIMRLPVIASHAVDVTCVQYRCNASRPWAVLWLHEVCNWAERVGPIPETAATTYRHETTSGPKVRGKKWKTFKNPLVYFHALTQPGDRQLNFNKCQWETYRGKRLKTNLDITSNFPARGLSDIAELKTKALPVSI